MPNDIYMSEFNKLREEVVGIDITEKVYQILNKFSGLDISVIKIKITRLLDSDKLTATERTFLAWALTNINAGISKQDFKTSMEGMANIVMNRKSLVEGKLQELFMAMQISGTPEQIRLAESVLNKVSEKSLYNQMLDFDAILKQSQGIAPDGENLSGGGRK